MWESQYGRQNLQLEKGLRWLVEIMPGKTLTLGSVGLAFLRGIRFIYCPHKSWCCFLPSAGQWRAVSFTVYPLPPTHDTPFYRQFSLPIFPRTVETHRMTLGYHCAAHQKGKQSTGAIKKRRVSYLFFQQGIFARTAAACGFHSHALQISSASSMSTRAWTVFDTVAQ